MPEYKKYEKNNIYALYIHPSIVYTAYQWGDALGVRPSCHKGEGGDRKGHQSVTRLTYVNGVGLAKNNWQLHNHSIIYLWRFDSFSVLHVLDFGLWLKKKNKVSFKAARFLFSDSVWTHLLVVKIKKKQYYNVDLNMNHSFRKNCL